MATATQRMREVTQNATAVKSKVALDTNCVQYYISNPPVQPWADCLDEVFRAGLDGAVELYVSNVVVSELLAHVHFANRHKVGYDPELDLLSILNRHFQILDVDGEVARTAGRLRGNYVPGEKMALETPDALIGATSIANGHTLFVTNDAGLYDALPEDTCVYLRDAALEWMQDVFPASYLNGATPIHPSKRGSGLPNHAVLANLELGSVKPDPSAKWERLLGDAFTAASALGEPCVFLILSAKKGRRTVVQEVLFWHNGLTDSRSPKRLMKHIRDHLAIVVDKTGLFSANLNRSVRCFIFSSLSRERTRQDQPGFASKSDHQREVDAWNNYLGPLWTFREALELPGTSWMLCEDGVAREANTIKTVEFLHSARNVLGWKDDR